jgi:hypothetical protein
MAEGWIFVDADAFHIHTGEGKDIHGKTARFNGAAKGSLEVGEKVSSQAVGPEQKRQTQLREDEKDYERADPFAVSAEARHEVEVSQKQGRKNRSTAKSPMSMLAGWKPALPIAPRA